MRLASVSTHCLPYSAKSTARHSFIKTSTQLWPCETNRASRFSTSKQSTLGGAEVVHLAVQNMAIPNIHARMQETVRITHTEEEFVVFEEPGGPIYDVEAFRPHQTHNGQQLGDGATQERGGGQNRQTELQTKRQKRADKLAKKASKLPLGGGPFTAVFTELSHRAAPRDNHGHMKPQGRAAASNNFFGNVGTAGLLPLAAAAASRMSASGAPGKAKKGHAGLKTANGRQQHRQSRNRSSGGTSSSLTYDSALSSSSSESEGPRTMKARLSGRE